MEESKPYIGIIGPNENNCSKEIYQFAVKLGKLLSDREINVVTGGKLGIMEAVLKGVKNGSSDKKPITIGIIQDDAKSKGNSYCDIVIPTGIGTARNKVLVNTSDIIIAIAGGAGTLSEIAFAWQMDKPIIAYTGFDGWAKKLAGTKIDQVSKYTLHSADSLEQIMELLDKLIKEIPDTK